MSFIFSLYFRSYTYFPDFQFSMLAHAATCVLPDWLKLLIQLSLIFR